MNTVVLPTAPGRSYWRAAQFVGIVLTLVLLYGLVTAPTFSLKLLWDVVIPVLPLTFLLNPMIWRNVCPLASLNEFSGGQAAGRVIPAGALRMSWAIGIILLALMVPARRFLFNTEGVVLAATIAAVAALALAGGFVFRRRAGFCSSICPVLPVERLYGQAPLVPMHGVRCDLCTVCTPLGCLDLTGTKSVPQTVGPLRRESNWWRTSFGAFAAAFPGFIIGYFTVANGPLGAALAVYGHILLYSAVSFLAVATLATILGIRSAVALPFLGAISIGAYYWFAAPAWATNAGIAAAGDALRVGIGAVILFWLWRQARTDAAPLTSLQ
ncbi:MAG: hypothetical protein FJ202_02030 [Gemmatimonadetes bacterium]|nr:hypothetical protein [Gemmatimonadota bacterium]